MVEAVEVELYALLVLLKLNCANVRLSVDEALVLDGKDEVTLEARVVLAAHAFVLGVYRGPAGGYVVVGSASDEVVVEVFLLVVVVLAGLLVVLLGTLLQDVLDDVLATELRTLLESVIEDLLLPAELEDVLSDVRVLEILPELMVLLRKLLVVPRVLDRVLEPLLPEGTTEIGSTILLTLRLADTLLGKALLMRTLLVDKVPDEVLGGWLLGNSLVCVAVIRVLDNVLLGKANINVLLEGRTVAELLDVRLDEILPEDILPDDTGLDDCLDVEEVLEDREAVDTLDLIAPLFPVELDTLPLDLLEERALAVTVITFVVVARSDGVTIATAVT